MKRAIQEGCVWTRGRFLGTVVVLVVLQGGLLFLFGNRSRLQPTLSAPSVRYRALSPSVSEDQLLRQFFVGDPAVFPLPNAHGFSGRGWLSQRPLEYQAENQLQPPIWLNLDTNRLGTPSTDLPSASGPIPAGLAEQTARLDEPLPVFLAPELIPTQSVFRLEGGLGDRLLGAAPLLRAWTNPQPLLKSVVQIAVDPAGEVVATRLEARCGLAEADAEALAKARTLRFYPSAPVGARWGRAVFQWQTSGPGGAGPVK